MEYRNFKPVIEKAKEACKNSGQIVENHLVVIHEMVKIGSGAERGYNDGVKLSRYACYLIVRNADPSKEIVALGQTYFAVQTRLQEIKQMDDYNRLRTEDEKDCSFVMKWQSTTSNLLLQPEMPEELPVADSLKKLEGKKEASKIKREL